MPSVVSRSVLVRMRLLGSRFRRDGRAATAVEFALMVVPFLMLVLGIFQIALYYFGVQSLDHATRLAAREIMLGRVGVGSQTKDAFKRNLLCPNFLFGFDCGSVVINATKVAASASQGPGSSLTQFVDTSARALRSTSSGTFCIGGPGDYIFMDVSYAFPNIVGSLFVGTGFTTDAFKFRSTNFFRNEPYKSAGGGC